MKTILSALLMVTSLAQAQQVPQQIGNEFQNFWQRRPAKPGCQKIGSRQERAVFLKTHGCARAKFVVDNVAAPYNVGLFSKREVYDAWVRISSDTVPRTPDQGSNPAQGEKANTVGFSVKVLGVDGPKVLKEEPNAKTHDFLVQNHHRFFVDNAKEFLEFTRASLQGRFDEFVSTEKGKETKKILDAMGAEPIDNVLGIKFWSTVPSKFGRGFAKYRVTPCAGFVPPPEAIPDQVAVPPANCDPNSPPDDSANNYLQTRLERDMQARGACFELQVQVRDENRNRGKDWVNPEPLDRAMTEWEERFAPFVTVAKIFVEPQDIKENSKVCEGLSLNPCHALAEHRPVGSLQIARCRVYQRMGKLRRENTGAPTHEPSH